MASQVSAPTFLETSWRASSSKAFTLFSLDVMICCNCLKVYGWKDILVSPWKWINNIHVVFPLFALTNIISIIHEWHLNVVKWSYQSTGNPVNHDSLRQIHSVCDGENHQTSVAPCWPIKQIIHHILFTGPQEVKLEKEKEISENFFFFFFQTIDNILIFKVHIIQLLKGNEQN